MQTDDRKNNNKQKTTTSNIAKKTTHASVDMLQFSLVSDTEYAAQFSNTQL